MHVDIRDATVHVGVCTTGVHRRARIGVTICGTRGWGMDRRSAPDRPFTASFPVRPAGARGGHCRRGHNCRRPETVALPALYRQARVAPAAQSAEPRSAGKTPDERTATAGRTWSSTGIPRLIPTHTTKRPSAAIRATCGRTTPTVCCCSAGASSPKPRAIFAARSKRRRPRIHIPMTASRILGVALEYQGKLDAAYDAYYKATWSQACKAQAVYRSGGDRRPPPRTRKALEHIDLSLAHNGPNNTALAMKSRLRKLAAYDDATRVAHQSVEQDPLDFWCLWEFCRSDTPGHRSYHHRQR